jgi:cytochrome c oxidase subunit 2
MGLIVFAVPPDEFDGWLASHAEAAAPPQGAAAQAGETVFHQADCGSCHTIRGTRARGDDGPDLTHLRSRTTIGATALANTSEHLAEWITDPHQFKPGIAMEPVELSDAELSELVAYLETLA